MLVEVFATDVDAEEQQFDPDNKITDPKDILTTCSTQVTTADITGYLATDQRLETLSTDRLAHVSVKEYPLSNCIRSAKTSIRKYFHRTNIFRPPLKSSIRRRPLWLDRL